jgi:hypothetical protein
MHSSVRELRSDLLERVGHGEHPPKRAYVVWPAGRDQCRRKALQTVSSSRSDARAYGRHLKPSAAIKLEAAPLGPRRLLLQAAAAPETSIASNCVNSVATTG